MDQPEKAKEEKETGSDEAARAEPAAAPADEKKVQKAEKTAELDPYWWAPWAVLIGLVLYGLLGFLGVLFPSRKGPTAADVPTPPPAASDKRPVPTR
jgi:hypothetical protein